MLASLAALSMLAAPTGGTGGLLCVDVFQNRGMGPALSSRLVQVGRDRGMERITAEIVRRNEPMQRLCRKLGFELHASERVRAVKTL